MIALVTDSTCDLGPAQLSQLGVTALPLRVQIEGQNWLDWEELDPDTLYTRMREGALATTSPPSTADFVEVYRRLLSVYDQVLSVHLSGALSETVQHARLAVQHLGAQDRVELFDSECATAPLAQLVLAAAQQVRAGRDLADVVRHLQQLRGEMLVEFTVTDLEYLRRGGRLSRTRAFLGNLLGVRPVLTFEQGRIVPARNVRGKNALEDMIQHFEERFASQPLNAVIAYAGRDREAIEEIRRRLEASKLIIRSGRIQLIGAVVGAYTGPGAYGLVAFPAEA